MLAVGVSSVHSASDCSMVGGIAWLPEGVLFQTKLCCMNILQIPFAPK